MLCQAEGDKSEAGFLDDQERSGDLSSLLEGFGLMGALGGSSGGTSPTGRSGGAYQPQAQPVADQGYQNLTSGLYNQAQSGLNALGGTSPAAQAWPYVQGTTQNVLTNPYQGQYVQGGQNAFDYFNQGVLPNINQGSQQLAGLGNLAAGAAPGALAAGQNPAYAQAGQVGAGQSGGFQGAIQQLLGDIFNPVYGQAIHAGQQAAPKQFGAADAIRTQAFDPQNALYNRTQARLSDQIGSGNANSGLAGTPYGESVRGNTLSNFNIDWQNQQLQRMLQGGTTAAGLDTAGIGQLLNPSATASSAAASDIGAAGSGLTSALDAFLRPANAATAASGSAANALGTLSGVANQGFQGANTLLGQGATGMNQFAGLPYSNYNTTQGNNFGALQNEISLGNQNYALPQQVLNDLQSYLGLGQSASGIANSIGTTNFNQLAQGVGGGIGALSGINSLTGGGITSGLGSLGSSLLGGGGTFGGGGELGAGFSSIGDAIAGGLPESGFGLSEALPAAALSA